MQITRLSLANVRPIERLELDVSAVDGEPRRRLVLLGANGAGKTTVLDAIAHAFQTLDASSDDFGAKALGAGDVRDVPPSLEIPKSVRTGEIRVAAVFRDRERRRLRALQKNTPASGELLLRLGADRGELARAGVSETHDPSEEASLTQGLAPLHAMSERQEASDKSPSEFALLGSTWSKVLAALARDSDPFLTAAQAILQEARPPCVHLAADRGVLDFRDDLPIRDVLGFDPRRGCLSKDRARFAALAARLALAWNNERSDPGGVAARMWKVLAKYFPDLATPVHVDGLMFWLRNRDGLLVPLPRLSDGERAILLIFAEVAFRAPEDGVVLIDEIEQHLHPKWQRAVLEGLSALVPTAQFIVTSQSPYIAATAPDDVVKIGDWDRDGA